MPEKACLICGYGDNLQPLVIWFHEPYWVHPICYELRQIFRPETNATQ